MGLLSKVKSAVSKAYNKVDSAVGGRLPGGVPSSSGKTSSSGTTTPQSSSSSSSSSYSSSSGSSSKSSGSSSSSIPAGTPVGSAVGGGVLRSDGKGGSYVDKSTSPQQALKEISSPPSSGKIGSSGKIAVIKVTDYATPKEGKKKSPDITRTLIDNSKGNTIQSQVSSVPQSKVPSIPSGTVVGSAPGGAVLVSDGKGGTKVVYKTRTERKQEAYSSAYEKSVREQTGSTTDKQKIREEKVKLYADKQFNYYQDLVNKGKISPEEATSKYNNVVSTYEQDLTRRDLGGATLVGMSMASGGKSFSVVPTKEQEAKAMAAGEQAAGGVKFTKRDIILTGQGGVSFIKDVATAPSRGVAQFIKDVSYTSKEGKKIISSPMSYEGGKAAAIAGVLEKTKTSQALRGFNQGVIGESKKVGRGIIKTGFYLGDYGYKKITGKEPLAQAPSYFNYDRSKKIYQDTDIRSAGVTVGTGFVFGGAFKVGGAVLKPIIGKTATTALGTTIGATAGGVYAYKVRSEIKLAEGTEAKGRVFGKSVGEAALFGGGLYAGSRLAGKAIYGLTPKVYSEPLPVDVKVSKPVSVTRLPKERNIYTDPNTGKVVTLDRGFPVGYVSEVGIPGRQVRLSTPFRESLGLQSKYVGGTAKTNPEAYQKALKSLQRQGYTPTQARNLLRQTRPQYQRTTFQGELSVRQVGDNPFERVLFGRQTTTYLPGEKGGVRFLQRQQVVKQISEQGTVLGENEVRFQTLEENFAKPQGKQTERFIGSSVGKSLGKGEFGVFQGELNKLGIDVYKTGQFEAYGVSTNVKRIVPSKRAALKSQGVAFVEQGQPPITLTDLSLSEAKGFQGRGKPSSSEYFKQLYSNEQITVLPSLKLPGVKKASSIKPSSQPSSPQPTTLKGQSVSSNNAVGSVLPGVSVGLPISQSSGISRFSSDFVRGFQNQFKAQTPTASATKQGQEEDQRVIRSFNVPYGKLPTYDFSAKTLDPIRTFTKLQEPVIQAPVRGQRPQPRESFRQPLLQIGLPLAAQRSREALRQNEIVRQSSRLRQQVIQRQTQFQPQTLKNPFPFPSPNPFVGFTPFRAPRVPVSGAAAPLPEFGPGFGGRGIPFVAAPRQYQYAPSLTAVLLGLKGTQIPRQQIFSGFEVRPAFFVPQQKPQNKRVIRRRR